MSNPISAKSFAVVLMAAIFNITSGCRRAEITEKHTKAIINETFHWFVTKGIGDYYKDEDYEKIKRYFKEKGGIVETQNILAYGEEPKFPFSPKEGGPFITGVFVDFAGGQEGIHLLDRIRSHGKLYEYWFLTIEAYFGNQISFFIAETDDLVGDREIIYKSDKYFSDFTLPEGTRLKFNTIREWHTLYYLTPWQFPESFRGTELEGFINQSVEDVYRKKEKIFEEIRKE